MAKQAGGCQCGEVRYELQGEPLTLYACHCTNCQTRTGSACSLLLVASASDVRVTRGEVESPPYSDKKKWCAACGTTLWKDTNGILRMPFGTFDDTRWATPAAHIWTRSAQPWVTIREGAHVYETQPEDLMELLTAWKERR
ncbi:MAG: GFA family protein [Myxococcales bacterium]|nr:GFA family protein [Myxococcales bacterium]